MIKVSIIVPVYNMKKYLRECLDSLVNQTLKDIEIICINDGSTDNSLEILNECAKKDNRIIVINKENEGQGIARNLGISKAQGEFVGFVDPDDWVELDMYEKMYNQAKQLDSEIVICDHIRYREFEQKSYIPEAFEKAISPAKSVPLVIESGKNIDKELINSTLLVSPCYSVNKIYNREFLLKNNIKFSQIRCFEDVMFILRSHILASKISYIDTAFYNYRIHKSSTLRNYENRYLDLLNLFHDINKYLIKVDLLEKFQLNLDFFIVINSYWACRNMSTNKYKKDLMKEVKKYLSKENYKLLCKKIFKTYLQKFFCLTNVNGMKRLTIFGIDFDIKYYNFNKPVDLVYCWVDGNDVEWQKEKQYWQEKLGIPVTDAINPCRFVDNEELKYSLRSVAQNLPWINHIYIITNGQVPKWLDVSHPKITIVTHKDIMPPEALPVFSAYPIETCLANIPNLSNYFLYINDDFFVYKRISKKYFFDKNGKPILRFCKQSKKPERVQHELYLQNVIYSCNLIKEKLGKYCDYETMHNIDAYRKDYFIECKNLFKNEFLKTTYSKFSSQNLVQRTIVNFYMLVAKSCKCRILRCSSRKSALENIYINLSSPELMDNKIQQHKKKLKLFCINDCETTIDEDRRNLKMYLESLFPIKAAWEKGEEDYE